MTDQTTPEPARFEALLTIDDVAALVNMPVAALVNMPVASLRYWRVLGTGPRGFIIGRRLRYRLDDVLAWIDACRDGNDHGAA